MNKNVDTFELLEAELRAKMNRKNRDETPETAQHAELLGAKCKIVGDSTLFSLPVRQMFLQEDAENVKIVIGLMESITKRPTAKNWITSKRYIGNNFIGIFTRDLLAGRWKTKLAEDGTPVLGEDSRPVTYWEYNENFLMLSEQLKTGETRKGFKGTYEETVTLAKSIFRIERCGVIEGQTTSAPFEILLHRV